MNDKSIPEDYQKNDDDVRTRHLRFLPFFRDFYICKEVELLILTISLLKAIYIKGFDGKMCYEKKRIISIKIR
jgi:hypothetical protein